jgi:hypothetical protein
VIGNAVLIMKIAKREIRGTARTSRHVPKAAWRAKLLGLKERSEIASLAPQAR